MIKNFCSKGWLFIVAVLCSSTVSASEDYFKKYAGGGIPVKVHYLKSAATKPMKLLGIDSARGIIYAEMEGAGRLELELRGLQRQNIKKFEFNWSRNAKTYLNYLSN
mgnify:FL=1